MGLSDFVELTLDEQNAIDQVWSRKCGAYPKPLGWETRRLLEALALELRRQPSTRLSVARPEEDTQ